MTGKKRHRLLAAMALGIMTVLCSCIEEDRSDCPPQRFRLRIGFEHIKENYERQVTGMDVFIFDSHGVLHKRLSESGISLTPGYFMETELPEGNYRFVSWTNLETDYKTGPDIFECGLTTFDEARLLLKPTDGNLINYDPGLLLHGQATAQVSAPSQNDQHVTIPLQQNNYRINLRVQGVIPDHHYTVKIADNNGAYYFNNDFASCEKLHYTRGPLRAPEGEFSTTLTTLRLERYRSPKLSIYNETTQMPLFAEEYDLVQLILARERTAGAPLVDFSGEHEFDIHIIYNPASLSATITINGWEVKPGNNEILE